MDKSSNLDPNISCMFMILVDNEIGKYYLLKRIIILSKAWCYMSLKYINLSIGQYLYTCWKLLSYTYSIYSTSPCMVILEIILGNQSYQHNMQIILICVTCYVDRIISKELPPKDHARTCGIY